MIYRIKLKVPCNDVHYFYAESQDIAFEMKRHFHEVLSGVDHAVWIYVETKFGHIRIDDGT